MNVGEGEVLCDVGVFQHRNLRGPEDTKRFPAEGSSMIRAHVEKVGNYTLRFGACHPYTLGDKTKSGSFAIVWAVFGYPK